MQKETAAQVIEYLGENIDLYNKVAEDLDDWCGYLGDDRYYPMAEFENLLYGTNLMDLANMMFFGHDADSYTIESSGKKTYKSFNPNREYFRWDGYGNLISTDYKDYIGLLDRWFVKEVVKYRSRLWITDDKLNSLLDMCEEEVANEAV